MSNSWQDENGNTIKIAIYWEKEDVEQQALDMGISLTDEEISDILDEMIDSHDCNFGITWTTIQCYINDLNRIQRS